VGEYKLPKTGRKRITLDKRVGLWRAGNTESGRPRYLHEFYREIVASAPYGVRGPFTFRVFAVLYLKETYAAINPPFHAAETDEERLSNPYANPAVLHEMQRKGLLPPNDQSSITFRTALTDYVDGEIIARVYEDAYWHVGNTTPGGLPPITAKDDRTHWSLDDHKFARIIEEYRRIYAEQYELRTAMMLAQKEEEERKFAETLAQSAPADSPALWPFPAYDPSPNRWRPPPGDWSETIWNPGVTHTLSPRESMRPTLELKGRLDLLEKYDDTPPRFSPRQSRLQMIAPIMLAEDVLRLALSTGVVPPSYKPHLAAFVGDLPPSTLATLVASGAVTCDQLRAIARQLLPEAHPTRTWLASQPAG